VDPEPILRGQHRGSEVGFYGYDFVLVVHCTRGRTSHRFRDIAFDMFNIARLPLLRLRSGGVVRLGRSS